jgi:hypothetical protein
VLQKPSMDQPLTYRFEFHRRIDERWATQFQGMTLTIRSAWGMVPRTIITLDVVVSDQNAMQALLRKFYNLGFRLLSVTHLEPNINLSAR